MSETEGEEDNNDVDRDSEEDTAAVDIDATVDNELDLSRVEVSVHHLTSKSTEDPLSCINEDLSKPVAENHRRKSTGSHDAASLPISVAAITKPSEHRRSASHNELDAMMTNNDGYAKQTPSPGKPSTPSPLLHSPVLFLSFFFLCVFERVTGSLCLGRAKRKAVLFSRGGHSV